MKIFEYPYVIIMVFAVVFVLLGAVGLYFALQGIKVAKGTREKDFTSVIRLENMFIKGAKQRRRRSVVYISVSLDNARSLYSDAKALEIFTCIKPVLLEIFGASDGGVSSYDKTNFVALNSWGSELVECNIDNCMNKLNHCLTCKGALNIVDIRFGYYCDIVSQISFDEAIVRAKQACTMAEEENCTSREWSSKGSRALERKIAIENNIEDQIDNNRFFLEYQPILYAGTKKIFGAEVLSRLNSEKDGVLTPGSFLPAVQSVGITDKFDYYIFEKNCKWISNDKSQRENYVYTINFSRLTLCDIEFSQIITKILDKYSVKYSTVAIEILEDKALSGTEKNQMIQNLKKLKELGISTLLDDFGSGYTSFGDLTDFNISVVKMDKKMVRAANTDSGFLVLKNVIKTAKELGFKTLCEGIETASHESLAIRAGADLLQGYYYSRPISPAKLEQMFEEDK